MYFLYFQIHDDLEKDHEYSGSGFGPDDEDSSSSHHTPHHNSNTNNRKDPTDLNSGSGDNGGNFDEEDITTDVKYTDIDPTTTDDEDVDSQCMAFILIFFINLFSTSNERIYDEHFFFRLDYIWMQNNKRGMLSEMFREFR